ncbi:TPA: hypothetical protein DEP94_01180 [Candidatus Nomurabacteria bacterium]|nr:hypothetical protein [Candidatus Nomurabacteria bacterium]
MLNIEGIITGVSMSDSKHTVHKPDEIDGKIAGVIANKHNKGEPLNAADLQHIRMLRESRSLVPPASPSFLEASHASWEDTAMPGDPVVLPQVPEERPASPTHNEKAECGWFIPPRGTLGDL